MSSFASPSAQCSEAHELSVPVDQLREELRVLRIAIDELRDDVVWAARQVLSAGYEVAPKQMPRQPLDPLAPDADYRYRTSASQPSSEISESSPYCCDHPQLSWNGDPEAPGVACENCGYVIAEQGDVIVQRDDHPSESTSLLQPTDQPSYEISAGTGIQKSSPPSTAQDSPATLSTTANVSTVEQQSAAPTTTTAPDAATARGKRQPLYMRIYQQPLFTDVVRAIGYEILSRDEARRRLEPLFEKHGQDRVAAATGEILALAPGRYDMWCLTFEARRASRALLGPPPLEPANGIPALAPNPLAEKSSDLEMPSNDAPATEQASEVKIARKVVLARFREHLDDTGEVTAEIPDDIKTLLGERGRMIPDLILGEAAPYELLVVRRTLSATQRHDMQEWLDVSAFGDQATRAWPQETAGGWEWVYEVVATQQDREESESDDEAKTANMPEE